MSTQTIPVTMEDSISVDQVGGDLAIVGWDRQELQVSGDVMRVERDDRSLSISSGGDLTLSVPRSMKLSLGSVGGDVTVQDLSGDVEVGLVGGDANLRNLSGRVQLTGVVGGETHLQNVANVSSSYANPGPDFDISDRIRRTIQQATQRAERKLRRAGVDRVSRVHQVRFDGSRWKYNSGPDAPSPAPSGDPVTEEERMTILRMLQEKKITSEEAEKLLSALEGNA